MIEQRPQYGELASPEEQRRAAGLPPLSEAPTASAVAVAPENASTEAPPARRGQADRVATIALLAYGLFNVVTTSISYLDLGAVITQAMSILGIDGEFTNYEQAKLWGTIAAVVLVIGWVLTALLSTRRLRRGKLTWWVPLVGAAVTMLVASICVSIPMMGDPAFIAYATTLGG